MFSSYKVDDSLFLVKTEVSEANTTAAILTVPMSGLRGNLAWSLDENDLRVAVHPTQSYGPPPTLVSLLKPDELVPGSPLPEHVFFLSDLPLGTVALLSDQAEFAWGTPAASGVVSPPEIDAVYAGVGIFLGFDQGVVSQLLKALGDTALIRYHETLADNPDDMPAFMQRVQIAIWDSAYRFVNGFKR